MGKCQFRSMQPECHHAVLVPSSGTAPSHIPMARKRTFSRRTHQSYSQKATSWLCVVASVIKFSESDFSLEWLVLHPLAFCTLLHVKSNNQALGMWYVVIIFYCTQTAALSRRTIADLCHRHDRQHEWWYCAGLPTNKADQEWAGQFTIASPLPPFCARALQRSAWVCTSCSALKNGRTLDIFKCPRC